MKKLFVGITLLFSITLPALAAPANLERLMPLFQKNNKTQAENQKVLQIFRTSSQPEVIFAAGASLVKTPPSRQQEPALFSLLLRPENGVKQTFAAVIITAMGAVHEELSPLLEQAQQGKDPVLRAYATAAYAILNPQAKAPTDDIVRLYIFDPAFATRAMNVVNGKEKTPLSALKKASASTDEQVRAAAASWLGTLHTQASAKQLLKMAKKETASQVQAAIATALAAQRENTLSAVTSGLRKSYTTPYANTCALALGFMTGNAVEVLRQNLTGSHLQARINAARATAYMAGVLANPDAFAYSSDRVFDIHLLKSLIAPLKVMEKTGNDTEKSYAQNALRQIEKLME